ncbi:MAG: ferredoxin-thioredoxin reductase catalytic domain-containing protein [Campylobacterota bacterium]|nr:ferredoxin-thioredoxin reductase catalytic domain-containing protein [Campylobacterota bacterium]
MQQIDMNSPEFLAEMDKTQVFVDKVNKQFNLVQNPNEEVNEGVIMGLARNRLMYGKRFCPCFMVIGETKEERREADNRICPCKPALEKEIPEDGLCHCGIFCTSEYAESQRIKDEIEEVVHQHSKGLTHEQAEILLKQEQLDGDELEALIEARELGMIAFELVDVREYMEYQMGHIVGTDILVPTSQFYAKVEDIADKKHTPIVVYCHTGSRSFQVQHAMKSLGFKQISNLQYGIISYGGETQRG